MQESSNLPFQIHESLKFKTSFPEQLTQLLSLSQGLDSCPCCKKYHKNKAQVLEKNGIKFYNSALAPPLVWCLANVPL